MPTSKRDPLHASHIIEWIEQVMAFILADLGEEIKGRSLEALEGGVLTIYQRDQKTPVVTLLKRLTEEPAQAWIPGGILASPKGARLPSCHILPDGEVYGDETKIWGIRNPDAYDQAVYLLIWDGRDLEHPKDKHDPRIHWPGWFSPSLKATDASPESKHQEALNTAECALCFLKKWKDKIKHEADQCPPIGTSSNSKETGTPPVVIIAGSANFYHDDRHQSVVQDHHYGVSEEQHATLNEIASSVHSVKQAMAPLGAATDKLGKIAAETSLLPDIKNTIDNRLPAAPSKLNPLQSLMKARKYVRQHGWASLNNVATAAEVHNDTLKSWLGIGGKKAPLSLTKGKSEKEQQLIEKLIRYLRQQNKKTMIEEKARRAKTGADALKRARGGNSLGQADEERAKREDNYGYTEADANIDDGNHELEKLIAEQAAEASMDRRGKAKKRQAS